MLNRSQRKNIQRVLNQNKRSLSFEERSEMIRRNILAGKDLQKQHLDTIKHEQS